MVGIRGRASNLAYLAESPGLDFGEKNGKAAFRFSSARPRDGASKTAKALPVMKVICTDSQAQLSRVASTFELQRIDDISDPYLRSVAGFATCGSIGSCFLIWRFLA